jgi:hypothetical protein
MTIHLHPMFILMPNKHSLLLLPSSTRSLCGLCIA